MKACKMHQFFLSSALDRSDRLPWLTARHLRDCGECREFRAGLQRVHRDLLETGRELRREALRPGTERSCPGLFRPQSTRTLPARRLSWRPLAGLAAALLLLVVGLRFLPLKPGPQITPAPERLETTRGQLALLLEARDGRTLESPLEDELQGMIASARLAAEFLAAKAAKTRRLLADEDQENTPDSNYDPGNGFY